MSDMINDEQQMVESPDTAIHSEPATEPVVESAPEPVRASIPESVEWNRYEFAQRQRDEFANRYNDAARRAQVLEQQLAQIKSGQSYEDADPVTRELHTLRQEVQQMHEWRSEREFAEKRNWLQNNTMAACNQYKGVEPQDVYAYIAALPDDQADRTNPWDVAKALHERYSSRFAAPLQSELEAARAELAALKSKYEGGGDSGAPVAPATRNAPPMPSRARTATGQFTPQSKEHDRRFDRSTSSGRAAGLMEALNRLS